MNKCILTTHVRSALLMSRRSKAARRRELGRESQAGRDAQLKKTRAGKRRRRWNDQSRVRPAIPARSVSDRRVEIPQSLPCAGPQRRRPLQSCVRGFPSASGVATSPSASGRKIRPRLRRRFCPSVSSRFPAHVRFEVCRRAAECCPTLFDYRRRSPVFWSRHWP